MKSSLFVPLQELLKIMYRALEESGQVSLEAFTAPKGH